MTDTQITVNHMLKRKIFSTLQHNNVTFDLKQRIFPTIAKRTFDRRYLAGAFDRYLKLYTFVRTFVV